MRGFQPNELAEHAALTELAALVTAWQEAEQATRTAARRALDQGARANVLAEQLGMSRPTLYRWIAQG